MRIVFAGTPHFAERVLAAVCAAGHEVALVITQPDRRAGRGQRFSVGAVKQYALEHGLRLFQPEAVNSPESLAEAVAARPDALAVAAYGSILAAHLLDVAPHGALNVHASLLPRWRGAAPVQRALLAGDAQTGISIMKMEAGLDTGPVLAQRVIAIEPRDTAGSLESRLALLGGAMMVQALADIEAGRAVARPQPVEGITYARKITKEEALLDWSCSAAELERKVRALAPSPGAAAVLRGERLKIWDALVAEGNGAPGSVLAADNGALVVACAQGALQIIALQRPGSRRVSAAEFLRGRPLDAAERFG